MHSDLTHYYHSISRYCPRSQRLLGLQVCILERSHLLILDSICRENPWSSRYASAASSNTDPSTAVPPWLSAAAGALDGPEEAVDLVVLPPAPDGPPGSLRTSSNRQERSKSALSASETS